MRRPAQGGFLLVEMLIGLMLTALLLQALFPLLHTSFLSWNVSVSRMVTHQTARTALAAMTRELRFASAVTSPSSGGSAAGIAFILRDANGKAQTLSFQRGLPAGGNSQTLYRITSPGQPVPLTENRGFGARFSVSAAASGGGFADSDGCKDSNIGYGTDWHHLRQYTGLMGSGS